MMPAWLSILVDLLIGGLLVATIVYAQQLNRRIGVLRDSKDELEVLVRGFTEATQRAEAGVESMRQAAQQSGEELQAVIARAGVLRDELKMMVEAADSLANRLEAAGSNARQGGASASASPSPSVGALRPSPLAGILAQPASAAAAPRRPAPAAPPPPRPAAMAAPAEPVRPAVHRADDDVPAPAPAPAAAPSQGDGLSKAERELIQALEKMRS
jgi:hypothetical protein